MLQVFIVNFSFFGISGWGIDLEYCEAGRFPLEMNRDHSVVFEVAPNYCISDSLVDYVTMCLLVIHVSYKQMYRTIDAEGFFHDYMEVNSENNQRTTA